MGKRIKTCPICGNTEVKYTKTKISDFIRARIECDDIDISLVHCTKCSFAFYDYRFSPEEEKKLYNLYRDNNYQKQREKYECWYTEKVNTALNNDKKYLREQQKIIAKILKDNGYNYFENALDFGGNKGATFIERWGTKNKYSFDISQSEVLPNITKVNNIEELFTLKLDFVMCNMTFEHLANPTEIIDIFTRIGDKNTVFYVEVPSEFPFNFNKFSIFNNISLLFNPNFNKWRLFKYYLKTKNEPFFTMKEHINFYTQKSLKTLVNNFNFRIIDVQENYENAALGKCKVLSILFTKQN